MADPKLTAIQKLQMLAAKGERPAIEMLKSLGIEPSPPSLGAAIQQGTKTPRATRMPIGTPFGPQTGPNPFEGHFPNLRGVQGTKMPAAVEQSMASDWNPRMGQNPFAGKVPNVTEPPVPPSLRSRIMGGLGKTAAGLGTGLMGMQAYDIARTLAGPQSASYLGGPLGQMVEGGLALRDKSLQGNMPELPKGPGLPVSDTFPPPYGPREEMTPEFAQQIMKTIQNGGGIGRGRKAPSNPFTFNDPTEMGPEQPEEMVETVDGFPEELQERQPQQLDMSMGGIVQQDQTLDPSLIKAGKKSNPLMRAIMGIGKGLGKVF